ncbi:GFA family protein [Sphingopyxis sp.]|jgi:hypothetical protein|uniref:GFA family protein n=1 Tax=Sphingopyxis sp. TaxID=1908224 RepID=UPI002E024FB9|nr:GFA family protein [Sphingopyxis sp.]
MAFEGSCHCGAVSYSVEGEIPDTAMSCNCSHCRRKGFLLTFVPIDRFRLESGADQLASYRFNKHNIDHQFCATCGCQSFSVGTGPDGSKMAAVNLRCVPAADLDALNIQKVDGASF